MASFHLLSSPLPFRYSQHSFFHPLELANATSKVQKFQIPFKFTPFCHIKLPQVRVSVNGDNGAIESPTPPRRGRKKKSQTSPSSSSSSSSTPAKQSKRSRKAKVENGTLEAESAEKIANEAETIEESKTLSPAKESIRWRRTLVELGVFEPKPATATVKESEITEEDAENYDDGLDFPYDDPPLICCFGDGRNIKDSLLYP